MTPHPVRAARAFSTAILLIHFAVIHVNAQPGVDAFSQEDHIARLMERTDLTFEEVNARAERYFARVGTGRGSGYKQYQRWRYERQFHLDETRMFIEPGREASRYAAFMRSFQDLERTNEPWVVLGPDTWNNTSGWNPGIGRITSVAVHPSNEQIIYVSSPGGGIWKSTNGGTTWTPLIDQVNSAWMYIYNLAIDPSNVSTLYAAVMNPGGGVIKSTNAGSTWTATGSGPSNSRKVLVHPSNSSIVLATAENGIWRSTNGGTSWTQVHPETAEDVEFKPGDPNLVYSSGTTNTIKRSTDNGVTWSTIGAAGGITHTGRTQVAVSANNPNVVYAVQSHPNLARFGRLYKSTNSGASFTTTVIGDPAMGTNFFGYDPNGMDTIGQAWHDMAMCVNPANANEVHIAGVICWKSTDGGFTFAAETEWNYPNNTGYNHADVHALEYVNSNIYAGTDGGIYISSNAGGDWSDLSEGLGIRQIYRMSQAKTDASRIVIGAQDNGTSFRQASGDWWDWLGADGMDNAVSPTTPNTAFGMWQFGGLNITTNGGQTRTYLGQPSDGNWITPLVMHPTNHDTLYGGWTGIYRSDNGGTTWTLLSGATITQPLNTLAVAPSNTKFIYGSVGSTLYRTSNGGSTWTSVNLPAEISSICVSPTQPEKIWVTLIATSGQVQVSTNMGTTFTNIASGLPALAARTVVVHHGDPAGNGLYVGLNIGVYYRNDTAPTWVPFGTSLPLVAVNELEVHEASGKIRVATYGRGVWENNLAGNGGGGSCTEYAYVPNANANNVSVIDLTTNAVVSTIPVGTYPAYVCHTSTGSHVYITNTHSDNVSVIETASQAVVATIPLASNADPVGIGITPDDSKVFVANLNGTVTVINTATHTIIQTITVGGDPTAVQVTPDGLQAYVSDSDLNRIVILNTSTYNIEGTIPLTSLGADLKFTPDGDLAFVMNGLRKVFVINTTTQAVSDSIVFPSGYLGTSLCVSPDGQTLYAGFWEDSPGPSLGIVNIPTLDITGYATGFCCGVMGISMSGDGSQLYVTNPSYNKVTIISTANHAATGSVVVGAFPTGRGDFVIDCGNPGGPTIACNTVIYDSGGSTGPYGNNENTVQTFCPANAEDKLVLDFMAFELEHGHDYLKIYDGPTTNAPPLHQGLGFTGTVSPGTLYSTDASGCLTLHFTSDATGTYAGWAAAGECVSSACGASVYDTGGPGSNYGNNEDYTETYCPALDGDKVEMTFLNFDLETGYDFLKIYDGPTTGAAALHTGEGYTGTVVPGPFVSTHSTGCLTIRFTSDATLTRPGWAAEIECSPIRCDTDFFDSGGPTGQYSNQETTQTVLCPDQPDHVLELEFLSFALEANYDYLQLFDGPTINAPPLHTGNGFTGSSLPGTFISTHASGCLTALFTSDESVTLDGWTAHLTCIEPGICMSQFADTGGPGSNYSNNEDTTTVLCPPGADQVISVTFTAFDVESTYDALYIFDGPTTASPLIHSGNPATQSGFPAGGYYGTNLPGTFVSSDPGGCLTLQFLSDISITRPGWIADIDCGYKPANDECADAIILTCDESFFGSSVNATRDATMPCQSQTPGNRTVWHRFTGNGDIITLSTCGNNTVFDTKIIVYSGTCGNLTCVAASDDDPACALSTLSSTLTFESQAGVDYSILVSGFFAEYGSYELYIGCDEACSTHVTTTADDGPGSLRQALLCTTSGDTITFDPQVNGQYIDITSGQIVISRNVVMAPAPGQQIRVRALGAHRILLIQDGTTVRIENVELMGGTVFGSAIYNEGTLVLKDVVLSPHPDEPENILHNAGMLTVIGLVEIRN